MIVALEVENMPCHHRILHVRQEILASGGDISVLRAVIDADVKRNTLIEEEKKLLQRLKGDGVKTDDGVSVKAKLDKLKALRKDYVNDADATFNTDIKRLDKVYERLQILGADAAKSRAGMILTGLQLFTPSMQNGPTSALSGGWRMRVALAAALFIESDLLMLDEP